MVFKKGMFAYMGMTNKKEIPVKAGMTLLVHFPCALK